MAQRTVVPAGSCDADAVYDDTVELLAFQPTLPSLPDEPGVAAVPGGARALSRADVCMVQAEHALGANALEEALDRSARGARHASREQLGRLCLVQATACNWLGRPEQAERAAQRALGALSPPAAPWFAAVEEAAAASRSLGHTDRLVTVADRLMEQRLDTPIALGAALRVALQLLCAGEPRRADRMLAAVRTRAAELARHEPVVRARWNEVRAFLGQHAGDPSADVALYAEAAQAFAEAGDARSACAMRGNVAEAYRLLGAFQRAAGAFREALALAAPMRLWAASVFRANLALTLARLGETEEALRQARAAAAELSAQQNRPYEARALTYHAQILLASGDAARAEMEAHAAVAVAADLPPERALALATLARAELARGRPELALEHATAARTILRDLSGLPEGEVLVRLVHIEALIADGRDREAVARHTLRAIGRLIARANQIRDPSFRKSFLDEVEENAALRAIADERLGAGEASD